MTGAPAPAPVVCEVSLRARLVVGEPFFDHGRPLTLGRVGAVDAAAGDLVAVAVTGPGRGTVTERLGRAGDVSAVLHGLAIEAGAAAPLAGRRRRRGRPAAGRAGGTAASAPTCGAC